MSHDTKSQISMMMWSLIEGLATYKLFELVAGEAFHMVTSIVSALACAAAVYFFNRWLKKRFP